MGVSYKIAGVIGSLIFGALLILSIDEAKNKLEIVSKERKSQLLDTMVDNVFIPYVIMTEILFVLGFTY